ncbi:M13 family metallopeptidase [Bogoriella caseilytica]|uniref:Putative endopeptidase n=1 Tax=Bogoriella caseilytica TaxID=56055 RepID=A0A3N2BFC5_9MICO|nr:M13-type metalloendopeptidase [Bogoriella caseilytica]ROR73910.1 putative endopeptidase [Bogoriella caseilytica]
MTLDQTPAMTDAEAIDENIRIQDDLYRHVNGRWLQQHEIPADRARDGSFTRLRDLSEEHTKAIIEDVAAGRYEEPLRPQAEQNTEKVGALYASFMDTERVESLGAFPLRADLDLLSAALNKDALTHAMGSLQPTGVTGGVGYLVNADFNDPDRYVVILVQSGLGLPDESYYREDSHAATRTAYVGHVTAMLAHSGLITEMEAMGAAEKIMAFETKLAAAHWDRVATREMDKLNNPMTWQQLVDAAPGFDWERWRSSLEVPQGAFDDLIVGMPDYMAAFARIWSEASAEELRLWLTWQVIHARAPYLSSAFVEENFDFYGKTLTGAQELRERWKRGVGLVEDAMGEAVGELYVARHFPPEHKARMQELVANLVSAYCESINALDWMGPETRERALEKLEAFTPKVGYPDTWRDYTALEIAADNLVGNVRSAALFEDRRELAKIGQPMDRSEWFMSPQTVNAYYNPTWNEIVFPAAILQPPFFDPEADDAWNYGGIGAVIGHEIGHGFDDQGSKYDGTGKMRDWWTAADREEFERRTEALIAQYDAYSPAQLDDTHTVNGALTVGENIGDLGGLSIGIKAYGIALREQGGLEAAPEIDGLTGLQRVFFSWGRIWREKSRDEEAIRLLTIDPHSPPEFRCNGVLRNLDAFHEAFDVAPGDALYLPPAERVRIW